MSLNQLIKNRLRQAIALREPLRVRTNALRLVNGMGDQLEGLILEQYDRHFVAQVFNAMWLKEGESLKNFLMEQWGVDYFIVKDRTQNASSNPEAINFNVLIPHQNSCTLVRENGICFEVNLNDTLNTGLFLDMRANRLLVTQACAGQRMLNCFAYTCSFGVYAKFFGARETINVDVSKKILEKGKRNYALNQLETQSQELIKADAVEYLEKAVKKNNCFDVIVIDPPSFARAGSKVFSIERDFPKLINLASRVLTPKGKLFVSTNLSSMSLVRLEQIVRKNSGERIFRQVTPLGQDQDFVGSGLSKESHLAAVWAER